MRPDVEAIIEKHIGDRDIEKVSRAIDRENLVSKLNFDHLSEETIRMICKNEDRLTSDLINYAKRHEKKIPISYAATIIQTLAGGLLAYNGFENNHLLSLIASVPVILGLGGLGVYCIVENTRVARDSIKAYNEFGVPNTRKLRELYSNFVSLKRNPKEAKVR